MCLGIDLNKDGLKHCTTLQASGSQYPDIKKDVKDIISDGQHFSNNSNLIAIIKPITDMLSRLEHDNCTLFDVWPQFLRCYNEIKKADIPERFESLRKSTLEIISSRCESINQPIFLLGFFFNPIYRRVCLFFNLSLGLCFQKA